MQQRARVLAAQSAPTKPAQAKPVKQSRPHKAIKRRRQLGAGGFAVVFEADIPLQGSKGVGLVRVTSRTCATKVFSFIAGMGERQTNFFKNWLHELQVLDYLSQHPECGVVDYYGFSLRHDEAEAKIVVQICMDDRPPSEMLTQSIGIVHPQTQVGRYMPSQSSGCSYSSRRAVVKK